VTSTTIVTASSARLTLRRPVTGAWSSACCRPPPHLCCSSLGRRPTHRRRRRENPSLCTGRPGIAGWRSLNALAAYPLGVLDDPVQSGYLYPL